MRSAQNVKGSCLNYHLRSDVDKKEREKKQAQLDKLKKELAGWEAKLAKAVKEDDKRKIVDYSMAVNGIKTTIREIGTQLR